MGAFCIWDVGFVNKSDRKKFEEKYKIKKKDILVDEHANSNGFLAWTYLRQPELDVIYYMGFRGYGDTKEMLKECLKEGIKIKFLSWLPINDRDAKWEKIRGRW